MNSTEWKIIIQLILKTKNFNYIQIDGENKL